MGCEGFLFVHDCPIEVSLRRFHPHTASLKTRVVTRAGDLSLPRPICRNVLEDFCCKNIWRIFPGIFLEDFSGHFFPQK